MKSGQPLYQDAYQREEDTVAEIVATVGEEAKVLKNSPFGRVGAVLPIRILARVQ